MVEKRLKFFRSKNDMLERLADFEPKAYIQMPNCLPGVISDIRHVRLAWRRMLGDKVSGDH